MLQEHVVFEVAEVSWPEGNCLHFGHAAVRFDEGENFGANMEVAEDEQIGFRRSEGAQSPMDQTVKRAVEIRCSRRNTAHYLDDQKHREDEGPQDREQPAA